jgi:SSS family solute:Na+ symporter
MQALDYVVLIVYFAVMIGIGVYTSRKIKNKDDYFMGGRGFGKLLQTFAAFGAGTGSADPVNTGRTTFTSGMSGMWSVMYWLFVTPFYWITGVWYRRMRHLTLGDWFVERYQSQAMGLGYMVFGLMFFMVYGSMMFSAIGKVAAPLVGFEAVSINGNLVPIE